MVDALHRNTGQILILFTCRFFLFGCSYLQIIRFGCGQVTDSFCFIEKDNLPLHFHKTDLTGISHLFTGSAEPALIGQHDLFHHQLHLTIEGLCLFCQFLHLVLKTEKQLDQQLLIQFIQLFFCVLKRHNRNSLSLYILVLIIADFLHGRHSRFNALSAL